MSATIVPVVLGCCPGPARCILCPPAAPPETEVVAAWIAEAGPGARVRTFGGAPPSDRLLDAAQGHDVSVRVRPDLLTRAEAARLRDRGVREIELDALTFDDDALKAARRPYRAAFLRDQAAGLRAAGFTVGGVLAPGLPGTDHATALRDAAEAARAWSFARLHPVIVLRHSALADHHAGGRYAPLSLGAAVTVCAAMLDVLEPAGVAVRRVGLQPRHDGFGRPVAGPVHPSLHEVVAGRRVFARARDAVAHARRHVHMVLRCAPPDVARVRGVSNAHVRALRAEYGLARLDVVADPRIGRGCVEAHPAVPEDP